MMRKRREQLIDAYVTAKLEGKAYFIIRYSGSMTIGKEGFMSIPKHILEQVQGIGFVKELTLDEFLLRATEHPERFKYIWKK